MEQSDKTVVIKSNKPYPTTENTQRKWHRRALCSLSGLTLVPPSAYLLNFSRVERFHITLNSRQQNHLCCHQSNSVCIKMDRHLQFTGAVNFSNSLQKHPVPRSDYVNYLQEQKSRTSKKLTNPVIFHRSLTTISSKVSFHQELKSEKYSKLVEAFRIWL